MITLEEPIIEKEEKEILMKAIGESSVTQGKYVKIFENAFGSYCSSAYACASFNGTAALHLALSALGIGPGDEVIVPSFTFIATSHAKPVFADIDPDTLCILPGDIEKRITKKTKAIIPVHVYGYPADLDPILDIAKKHKLSVIEDAAEAHGAEYKGRKVGALADIGCFSFHASKILRTGEGGMCLTNSKELDARMRLLRSHGKPKKEELTTDEFIMRGYYSSMMGYNYRMTDLQAAIGIAQTKKIDSNIAIRRRLARIYTKEFERFNVSTQVKKDYANPVHWVYPVIFDSQKTKLKVGRELVKRKVPFIPAFWPCHKAPFYHSGQKLPTTESIAARALALPCNSRLTEDEASNLANTIGKMTS